MKIYDSCIPNYSKLYYRLGTFKNFSEIDDNQLYEIMEMVNRFKNHQTSDIDNYRKVIDYLTNPRLRMICDFDIKMAFLILCCDPYLIHFFEFIEKPIISESEIKKIESIDDVNEAKFVRRQQTKQLEDEIKSQAGFYDPNLINLEFSFFRKFYSDKMLVSNVKMDMVDSICDLSSNYLMLKKITCGQIIKVINSSNNYLRYISEHNKKLFINTLSFNTLYQSEMLGLENNIQKLLFFIVTIDRECKALSYFDSLDVHSKKQEIENFIGFYNEDFIKAEKEYQKIMHK